MTNRVAIIGMSYRLPGTTQEQFWQDLLNGKDLVTEVDSSRWSKETYFNPRKAEPGTSYTFSAGSLGDVSGFDAGFFGISPREAALMDPQQRLLLELAWESLEDAGIKPSSIRGSQCGVYIGIASADYSLRLADDLASINSSVATGNTASIAANRISYVLDLHGPSMALDTACSSSLVAFHQACQAIGSGECNQAITGGVSLHLHPYGFLTFSKATMLSRRGICNVFDAAGDGYVRSEGGGIFVLKNYDDALADGDRIIAVVASSSVNTDGKKSGLTVPSSDAQSDLLRAAYEKAGIDPASIDYIEAHGTGTSVGDPIETLALGRAIGQQRPTGNPLLIGSVKSNVGHLEAASGVAGMIKALHCIQHRTVPATIHLKTPNPHIDFDGLNIKVVTESTPLKSSGKLIVGVNSFGFGGANAHVIVESPEVETSNSKPPRKSAEAKAPAVPLLFSGKSTAALKANARQYAGLLSEAPECSAYDVAFASAFDREWHPEHRGIVFGTDAASMAHALDAYVADGAPALAIESGSALAAPSLPVFVYSGNGSQWEGMGKQLLVENATFKQTVQEVDHLFMKLADFSIEEELAGNYGPGRYERTEVAQPTLFALQVGVTQMLRQHGIEPAAVVGHSVGEVAAAWASGALTLEQAVRVIFYRSKWQGTTKGLGQMTAVSLGEEATRDLLDCSGVDVTLAGVNSSHGVTIAGKPDQLAALEHILDKRKISYKRLNLDYAFHSSAMDSIEAGVLDALKDLAPTETVIPFYSTVTGNVLSGTKLDATYWWHNIRRPVLFESAIKALQAAASNVFVEVGPNAVLRGYINTCLKDERTEGRVIPTLAKNNDSLIKFWKACAQIMISGTNVDWSKLFPKVGNRVTLPTYPWQRERHWHTSSAESYQLLHRNKEHPYLGYRLKESEWMWENHIDTLVRPTLADHVVGDAIIFPGTGFAEMALAAARLWLLSPCLEIAELEIRSPLLLSDEHSKTVRFQLEPSDGSFTIVSRERLSSEPWTLNAVGRIIKEAQSTLLQHPCPELPTRAAAFDTDIHHALTSAVGLSYGPAFRTIDKGWVDGHQAVATFLVPDVIEVELENTLLHPALLDCTFQLLINILHNEQDTQDGTVFVPTRMGRLIFKEGHSHPKTAQATLVRRSPHSLVADFTLFDDKGDAVAWVKEARFRGVRLQKAEKHNIRLVGEHWIPKPHPMTPDNGTPLPLEMLKDGLHGVLHTLTVQKSLRQYADEIEPLLDALCSEFAASSLRKLAAGQEMLTHEVVRTQIAKVPETAPYLMRLIDMLEEDGTIRATESGWCFANGENGISPQDIWNSLVADYPDHFPIFHTVGRIGLHLDEILAGHLSGGDVLPRESSLGALAHQTMGVANIQSIGSSLRSVGQQLLALLPASRRFKIVELSAGSPSYASQILPSIDFDRCDYVVASPSSAAADDCRPLVEQFPRLEVRHIDLTADATKAYVPPGESAQLAIVTNDFATEDETLKAISYARQQLGAGGTLIFVDQYPSRWLDFAFGWRHSWWSESTPGKWASRQRSAIKWQPAFNKIGLQGFTHVELLPETVSGPYMLLAQSTGVRQEPPGTESAPPSTWIVLTDAAGYSMSLADELSTLLETAGHNVVQVIPASELKSSAPKVYQLDSQNKEHLESLFKSTRNAFGTIAGVLHLQGLEQCANAVAPNASDALLEHPLDRCATAAALIQAAEASNVNTTFWMITSRISKPLIPGQKQASAAFNSADIVDAPLFGFSRTLTNEANGYAVRLVDIAEPDSPKGVRPVARSLARELLNPDAELEIAFGPTGTRFATRLRLEPSTTAQQADDKDVPESFSLGFQFPGQLRNLRWESHPMRPLADDEVDVKVCATGLNFRDVMYALGLLSDEAVESGFAGASLGLEMSGIVERVGRDVEDLSVGDKVVAFGSSCFGNRVITKASATALKPTGVSFEAASTIPSTFFTSYYSLHHLARLQAGERVLIHGAAGGVGLAAIQIAKWCGAEIFATAGTEEKRDVLRLLGVDHVLDSRSLAFADQILKITDGRGIDVVLNSLAGEAINRNFSVLKPFGRFIELGKRDFYENTKIGLRPFRNNISYFGVDADQLMSNHPELTKKLFDEVMSLFDNGSLHPLPYHVFDSSEIVDAFRYMQQSRQIGKVVVTYRNGIEAHKLPNKSPPKLKLPDQATYLVTGGLSGFGLKTAEWLADKGARHLVLLSRSGPSSAEAQAAIAILEARDVHVHAVSCDVTDMKQLAALFEYISANLPPLRGVVHAAMVIDDALVRNMNAEQIRRVFEPKILGAQHLHALTAQLELDFFVLFSSATTLFGNPGQGNYVAANAYLEAMVEARRAAGLPALCVRWGALDDVGFLARNEQIKTALQSRMGGAALHSSVALDTLESLLVENRSGLGVMELDWKALSRFLPTARTPRFSGLSVGGVDTDSSGDDTNTIQRLLAELSRDELISTFATMLKEEVGEILRIPPEKIDENQSIFNMGLDSLMGVELVLAVEAHFGVKLPVMSLKESPTILKLSEKLCSQLTGGEQVDDDQPTSMQSQIEHAAKLHGIEDDTSALGEIALAIDSGDAANSNRMIH